MKSIVIVFACILYSCHAGVVNGGKDAVIDGKDEKLPAVTEFTTESMKTGSTIKGIPIGPGNITNSTTVTPPTPTSTSTTLKPTTPTPSTTTTSPTTPKPSPTPAPTTPSPSPKTPTTPTTSTKSPTTKAPIPSSTAVPVSSTTVTPPSNRGFDGPSFIGGIVLASGLMAIGFVALKFYKARTELNYHTL